MKTLLLFASLLVSSFCSKAQTAENIIIITTDGFRWQEVFNGMDSSLANDNRFNQGDSSYIFKKYWSENVFERRKKLMPFLWSVVEQKGQLYGNRTHGNNVDNANPFWFSYPGYSEIFTGFADTLINSNAYPPNPNSNLLEFLDNLPAYKNRIAAFGAWDAFDRILNQPRNKLPVFSAFDTFGGSKPNATEKIINQLSKDSYHPFGEGECLDVFTHYAAFDYLKNKKPKVFYIAYGETDEWAHIGHYKDYLDAAAMVDKWIREIWEFIQSDPQYKNKTALFITVDHGRGLKDQWTDHYSSIPHSNEIWFAAMGPGVTKKGEVKSAQQHYQKQFAQTIANMLGQHFKCEHAVAEKIDINN